MVESRKDTEVGMKASVMSERRVYETGIVMRERQEKGGLRHEGHERHEER